MRCPSGRVYYLFVQAMHSNRFLLFVFTLIGLFYRQSYAAPINREAVVKRHKVTLSRPDSLSSLTVGNGAFAFTVDITGLQTFPEYYKTGVALGTQSEWGWHSFPNTGNYRVEEAQKVYELNGRKVSYTVQPKQPERAKEATEYFRVNDHRLQLGNIGFELYKKDGSLAAIADIKNITQELDAWTGIITSRFTLEGVPVTVTTVAGQQQDVIGANVVSPLLQEGRLKIRIRFPYPTGQFKDEGTFYGKEAQHQSAILANTAHAAVIVHQLDSFRYALAAEWSGSASLTNPAAHEFIINPGKEKNTFSFSALFTPDPEQASVPAYTAVENSSRHGWQQFWLSGGAVDFAGSTDKRAAELERRIILSQYLTRVQGAGHFPPQETGLTYNSWYGKPHLEMYWWHAAHFALWGRPELLEKSLDWYFSVADGARAIAKRQGYKGLRWQKMTNHKGEESPSSVGAFLIWQQPHFIYLAELLYRNKTDVAVLNKYKELVFATADFMASFPVYDTAHQHYNLGKGLIPAQECFEAVETYNPTFELAYWSWTLQTAQHWRERLGMPRNPGWDEVIRKLAPLPQKDGVYLATESTPDCYEPGNRRLNDHPAVLGALGIIPPANGLDTAVMHRTFDLVDRVWHWDETWGWDFPLVAMTASRLGQPEKALDALFKNIRTNTYLPNGHNYQDERLTIYLPGNGGLLSAVALMCAGYDGRKASSGAGFPATGWKVRWEGLQPMP